VQALVKIGLLTTIPADKRLVFQLNKATVNSSVKSMSPTSAPQVSPTSAPQGKPAPQHDLDAWRDDMNTTHDQPMNPTPQVSGNNTKTPPPLKTIKTDIQESGGGGDFVNFIFPEKLGQRSVEAISKLLPKGNDETAQALLDELSGMMKQQEIKSPTGYFRGIIKRFNLGDFEPTSGVAIAERRQQVEIDRQEAKARHNEMHKPKEERVVDQEKLNANRAAMKAALKPKRIV